jgi:hypothetical protein
MRRFLSVTAALAVAAMPLPSRADASSDLQKAGERFAQLKYWHATLTAPHRPPTEADFAAPDRFRMTLPTGPAYFIGHTMYISMNGHYMKIASPQAAAFVQQMRSPANAAKFAQSHKVQDLGSSSAGGVPTHAYAFDDTAYGIRTHTVIDVGQGDGLPHRAVITSDRGVTTVTYGKFGVPIAISPPI